MSQNSFDTWSFILLTNFSPPRIRVFQPGPIPLTGLQIVLRRRQRGLIIEIEGIVKVLFKMSVSQEMTPYVGEKGK